MRMLKLILILPCLIIMFQPLNAKVDPPNYNFDLETLADFFPGRPISGIESKFGKGEVMNEEGRIKTIKYIVRETRYSLTAIVLEKEGIVEDFFVRLPGYFLHDVFFQALINRHGKQTSYKKVQEEAYYVWKTETLKQVYSAACTITCFPIFYSVQKTNATGRTLLDKMQRAMP